MFIPEPGFTALFWTALGFLEGAHKYNYILQKKSDLKWNTGQQTPLLILFPPFPCNK